MWTWIIGALILRLVRADAWLFGLVVVRKGCHSRDWDRRRLPGAPIWPWGFGLWACLPDPKRALGAHGVPLIGEVRLRRTSLTLGPCGVRAGYTPPSAVVLVQARDNVAWHMQGTESGLGLFTGIGLETVVCGPLLRPTGARDA